MRAEEDCTTIIFRGLNRQLTREMVADLVFPGCNKAGQTTIISPEMVEYRFRAVPKWFYFLFWNYGNVFLSQDTEGCLAQGFGIGE